MRKRPAPVNVSDQQARRVGMQCHPHVDDVAVLQIDFSRRARAFNHHHVVFKQQLVQRLRHHRPD